MGNYLWLNEDIGKKLNFKKEIKDSKFLEGEIFNKDVKKFLLEKNTSLQSLECVLFN